MRIALGKTAGIKTHALQQIARTVSLTQPVALLQNDGALVVGTSPLDVFDRLEVLEATAEALLNARQLGRLQPLNNARIRQLIQMT